jgi:8-oxo-dGTP pyrophosphatase MutT (NUDIX family)
VGEQIDGVPSAEETGIQTFHSIIGFRQTHGAYGRSDLFFVCRWIPTEETDANSNIVAGPFPTNEDLNLEWVPLSEYRAW